MNLENEQLLIEGCKRGESWARKALYDHYANVMLSLCVRYVGDYDTAKDILQDGFVKVFTKIGQFENRGVFDGWIRQIFVNTSLEYLRQKRKFQTDLSMDDLEDSLPEVNVQQMEDLSAEDLMECIAELSVRNRTVFNLYAVEGYSHAEIAQKLGIQESSSRAQFARARKILQKKVLDLLKKRK